MLRKRVIRLHIIFLGLLSVCYVSFAQSLVSVPDTIIPRGQIYSIPITGIIEQSNVNSIRIKFQYNARVIDIKSASGADYYIMKCQTPNLSNPNFSNIDTATIDISCDSLSSIKNGVICIIDVEGLAGSDSLTMLTPIAIYENGILNSTATLKGGTIKVPGAPVYQRYPEGLGQNYPNPFSGYTFFPISIEKATKVEFKIFANDGGEVFSDDFNYESLQLYKVTNTGNVKINRFEDVLEKGSYSLTFIPDAGLASGSYFLVMLTDNGIYNKRFLYLK